MVVLSAEESANDMAIQAWRIATSDICNMLREVSEVRFVGDTLSFNQKVEEVIEIIENQSDLYEQLTTELEEQKRVSGYVVNVGGYSK